jgi:hypothetical protein
MLALMSSFADTYTLVDEAKVPGEDDIEAFDRLGDKTEKNIVVKRSSDAYTFADSIPESIDIIYMVRHPLDVMTSTLQYRAKKYQNYIPPERWLLEAKALRSVLYTRQSALQCVRYEDLVSQPDATQQSLSWQLGLHPARKFSDFHAYFSASKDIHETMNDIRPVDTSSVGRWREPARRDHVCAVWDQIQPLGRWFCEQFGYDTEEIDKFLGST